LTTKKNSFNDVASKDALLFVLEAARAQLSEPVGAFDARLVLGNLDRRHLVRDERLGELDKRLGLREGAAGLLLGRAVRRHHRAEDVLQHTLAEVEAWGRARGAPAHSPSDLEEPASHRLVLHSKAGAVVVLLGVLVHLKVLVLAPE
jgi:hypothetical protein